MSYLLGMLSKETRQKVEQVKAYLNAMQNRKNPLHDAVKEEKWCRLARGKSWMDQAEQSIQHVCGLSEFKQVRDWEHVQLSSSSTTRLCTAVKEHRLALPWMASWKSQCRSTNACRSQQQATWHRDLLGCSVTKDWSGWGFTVKQGGKTVYEDSGAHRVTTSSLTIEVEAVTQAIQWLASQCDEQITHAIILTDSCKRWSLEWAHSHAQSWATKTSVDLLSWAIRGQWEWTGI